MVVKGLRSSGNSFIADRIRNFAKIMLPCNARRSGMSKNKNISCTNVSRICIPVFLRRTGIVIVNERNGGFRITYHKVRLVCKQIVVRIYRVRRFVSKNSINCAFKCKVERTGILPAVRSSFCHPAFYSVSPGIWI